MMGSPRKEMTDEMSRQSSRNLPLILQSTTSRKASLQSIALQIEEA
jgi:hypothetical protein